MVVFGRGGGLRDHGQGWEGSAMIFLALHSTLESLHRGEGKANHSLYGVNHPLQLAMILCSCSRESGDNGVCDDRFNDVLLHVLTEFTPGFLLQQTLTVGCFQGPTGQPCPVGPLLLPDCSPQLRGFEDRCPCRSPCLSYSIEVHQRDYGIPSGALSSTHPKESKNGLYSEL